MRWLMAIPLAAYAATGDAAPAAAERHMAPVIGSAACRAAGRPLHPAGDARDAAAALERLGVEVRWGADLDHDAMADATRGFALFPYAGHGLQIGGQNYLAPVDARFHHEPAAVSAETPVEAAPLPRDGGDASAERRALETGMTLEDRRRVQRSLGLLGLYRAELDGQLDADTRAAIQAFQERMGEPGDGHLSRRQLALLHRLAEEQPVCAIEVGERDAGSARAITVSAKGIGRDPGAACAAAQAAAAASGQDQCAATGGTLDPPAQPNCDCVRQAGPDSVACTVRASIPCQLARDAAGVDRPTVAVETIVCNR
ncbi:MAG TPA: peptidoglycan-binding protein [Geminicoccaceae bacterium]|nr:peptidoglycan-binding protein [Geminicoccaceae bacterium]